MAEEPKIKCKTEFDAFIQKTGEWVEKQKELIEVTPTPEKVEEITKIYLEVMKKAKEFSKCEFSEHK